MRDESGPMLVTTYGPMVAAIREPTEGKERVAIRWIGASVIIALIALEAYCSVRIAVGG